MTREKTVENSRASRIHLASYFMYFSNSPGSLALDRRSFSVCPVLSSGLRAVLLGPDPSFSTGNEIAIREAHQEGPFRYFLKPLTKFASPLLAIPRFTNALPTGLACALREPYFLVKRVCQMNINVFASASNTLRR